MNEEELEATWWKIWIVSCIAFLPACIIPFFLFETEIERALAPIKTDYLTVFGSWFVIPYGIWMVFSLYCIYQITTSMKKQKEEVNEQ